MSGIINLGDHRNYYLYRKETDMRKGFDSLCGLIRNELNKQLMNGDAYIFINKPRTHLKLLVREMDGFTIVYRRLEKGTFEMPLLTLTRTPFRPAQFYPKRHQPLLDFSQCSSNNLTSLRTL
jgi:transposase